MVCVYTRISVCVYISYTYAHRCKIQTSRYRYIYLKKGNNKNTKLYLHCGSRKRALKRKWLRSSTGLNDYDASLTFTKLACNSPPHGFLLRGRSFPYTKSFVFTSICTIQNKTSSAGRDCGFAGTFKLSLNWKAIKSLCLQIIHLIVPQIWQSS